MVVRLTLSFFISLLGIFWMFFCYYFGIYNFIYFIVLYCLIFVFLKPNRAISPLSIFYGYYGVFYIVAPLFAERYQENVLNRPEFLLSYAFVYTVFSIGAFSINYGEYFVRRLKLPNRNVNVVSLLRIGRWVKRLFVISTLLIVLIVLSSGGFSKWIADPGDAFLNRGGSGVFVILSQFSSMALAALVGFVSFKKNSKKLLYLFYLWIVITSPVHGSKGQMALLIILSLIPWLRNMSFGNKKSLMLYFSFICIFFLGLYFRNFTWIDSKTFMPYVFNYFTTLENLAVSVRDFDPDFLKTFFLPFVKFLTPFGLERPDMYFDMNHMLTDIYYPTAWEMRATEQWPVETDLYLNFYFFGGLPIVGMYLFIIGISYGYSLKTNSLGSWFATMLLTMGLISHLRGSLYNSNDFYLYPYIIMMFYLFRNFEIKEIE